MKKIDIPLYFTKEKFCKDPLLFKKYLQENKDVVFQKSTSEEIHCFYESGDYCIMLEGFISKENYFRYKDYIAFEKRVNSLSHTFNDVKVQKWG